MSNQITQDQFKQLYDVLDSSLQPDTIKLVQDFALALSQKLRRAELKYGVGTQWKDVSDDWPTPKANRDLLRHVEKGDPLDVAAYCAFMWFHGCKTSLNEKDFSGSNISLSAVEAARAEYARWHSDDKPGRFVQSLLDSTTAALREENEKLKKRVEELEAAGLKFAGDYAELVNKDIENNHKLGRLSYARKARQKAEDRAKEAEAAVAEMRAAILKANPDLSGSELCPFCAADKNTPHEDDCILFRVEKSTLGQGWRSPGEWAETEAIIVSRAKWAESFQYGKGQTVYPGDFEAEIDFKNSI